eukprot:1269721-Pleurochrysis_carterae.AAC.1
MGPSWRFASLNFRGVAETSTGKWRWVETGGDQGRSAEIFEHPWRFVSGGMSCACTFDEFAQADMEKEIQLTGIATKGFFAEDRARMKLKDIIARLRQVRACDALESSSSLDVTCSGVRRTRSADSVGRCMIGRRVPASVSWQFWGVIFATESGGDCGDGGAVGDAADAGDDFAHADDNNGDDDGHDESTGGDDAAADDDDGFDCDRARPGVRFDHRLRVHAHLGP